MPYALSIEAEPNSADETYVFNQLIINYNRLHAPDDQHQVLNLFVRDAANDIVAGLLGDTYWGWLSIKILWVHADLRKQGWGTRLLKAAEEEAMRRGCTKAHVDTMDFQAPDFYKKHDYTIWGVLEDMPVGHQRIFLKKQLTRSF